MIIKINRFYWPIIALVFILSGCDNSESVEMLNRIEAPAGQSEFRSCKKKIPVASDEVLSGGDYVLQVFNQGVSSVSKYSAMINAYVTAYGGGPVVQRGVCWSENEFPDFEDAKTLNGSGDGFFRSSISNLSPNTSYFVRAYAINSVGIAYSELLRFTTEANSVLILDGDSRTVGWNCAGHYPYENQLSLDLEFSVFNTAYGGLSVVDLISRASQKVDPKRATNARWNLIVVWAGINDISVNDKSAIETFNNLVFYCNLRRKLGWTVIVCTEVSTKGNSSYGECDQSRLQYNELIRENWSKFADAIADLGDDPHIGAAGAFADSRFFCDGIHLTNEGYRHVAPVISKVINQITAIR